MPVRIFYRTGLEVSDGGHVPFPRGLAPAEPAAGVYATAAAKAIMRALRATSEGTLREGFFLDLLRRGFPDGEARRQLDIAIDWGRYGELFEYDAESGQLALGSDPAKVGV
jgi:hypothetical protein